MSLASVLLGEHTRSLILAIATLFGDPAFDMRQTERILERIRHGIAACANPEFPKDNALKPVGDREGKEGAERKITWLERENANILFSLERRRTHHPERILERIRHRMVH